MMGKLTSMLGLSIGGAARHKTCVRGPRDFQTRSRRSKGVRIAIKHGDRDLLRQHVPNLNPALT